MSHNATPNTSRVELRKTLTLVPVVMMGLAYMQPMTLFDTFGIVSGMTDGHVPTAYAFALIAILFYCAELREAGSPLSFRGFRVYLRPEIH
ncbi:Putrescine importer [Klebsiella aerogenes]|nr:Putrescine importer [Klebsiella aerogenes]